MSTSDIELAVTTARRLEGLLEARFGAEGRGLHEKLASVEARLPPEALSNGRYVATMRNKVVHEDSFALPDRERFLRCAQAFEKALGGKVKVKNPLPTFPSITTRQVLSVLIFLTGAVIWANAPALLKGQEEGFILLAVAALMTVIPPIIWLARFVKKYKRGVVVLLVVFGLLWIIVASMEIAGRNH
jgi:hypothetical protein